MSSYIQSAPAAIGAMLLAGIVVVLAACSTLDATGIQYVGVPRYAPSSVSAVQILRTVPAPAHERLGEIVVDSSVQPGPPVAEIENRLRSEAAKLGADAVVVTRDRLQRASGYGTPLWDGEGVRGRELAGVAIKYR